MEVPRLVMAPAGGIELAVWEWAGAEPALLFAHATGFHGRCWDAIARRFPGQRRLAIEFRGHGRSSKPDPPYFWPYFAADLTAVGAALGVRDAVGIGHSMGGHSIVAAAIENPAMFRSLVLIDATIWPVEYYGSPPFDASFIRRRKSSFDSHDAMWQRFHERLPFSRWADGALRDYCEFGLLPSDGHFVLACPPEVEASIYEHSMHPASNLYPGIPSVAQPVLAMRSGIPYIPGKLDLNASPTAPELAWHFPRGRDLPLPDHNHYIPMEAPGLVAEWIGVYLAM